MKSVLPPDNNDDQTKSEEERLNSKYLYIRKNVSEALERYRQHVKEMTPYWQEEGHQMRTLRDQLHISRRQLSQNVGVCSQVIAKLEKGEPIRSRNAIKQSCLTSMKFINLQRSLELQNFKP